MTDAAQIIGTGWVCPSSMGRPGHVQEFHSSRDVYRLSGKSVLGSPYKPFGRMDHFSKLGFSAISFAMADAGILPAAADKTIGSSHGQAALIAESATGCIETDLRYHDTLSSIAPPIPSPTLFAYTLPSCFLGEASIYFGLTGESYMVEQKECTGLTALSFAMDSLSYGGYETVICGICNSGFGLSPDTVFSGAVFIVLKPISSKEEALHSHSSRIISRACRQQGKFYLGPDELPTLTHFVQKEYK